VGFLRRYLQWRLRQPSQPNLPRDFVMSVTPVQIGAATLYNADCRDVLPLLGKVDAVVTDPPYGIGFDYASHDDDPEKWFALMNDVVPLCRAIAPFVIMPSCAIKRLSWWYEKHQPDWLLAWHKGSPGHQSAIGFNDWEPHVVWGRPKKPMHDYFSTRCGFDIKGHPCPKPPEYARWLVSRSAEIGDIICDPFMGSGTTGMACHALGRRFVGIEKDPEYFALSCNRIEQAQRQSDLFIKQPEAV
jgi:site-specific DNA-methyltransferase (adenine-specific)